MARNEPGDRPPRGPSPPKPGGPEALRALLGPALPRPGGRIEGYTIVRELAQGGMGAVYEARGATGNSVAIKVLLASPAGERRDANEARFEVEAQAAASLKHPGVVTVHAFGRTEGGLQYLVMDLVPGESLGERLEREGPLPPREAAALIRQVARTLGVAHARGLIHRDVKPQNVLLTPDGRTVLTDFGLAKVLDQREALTRTGQVLGTPLYMPPEQAGGARDRMGPPSDVYSLGATLFCLLTGEPPFSGGTQLATLLRLFREEPRPPSALRPEVDGDLDAICLKCLAKIPGDRYPDGEALAADLDRYAEGQAVSASESSIVTVVRRWSRRHRTSLLAGAWGALMVLGFAAVAVGTGASPAGPSPPPTGAPPASDTTSAPTSTRTSTGEEEKPQALTPTAAPDATDVGARFLDDAHGLVWVNRRSGEARLEVWDLGSSPPAVVATAKLRGRVNQATSAGAGRIALGMTASPDADDSTQVVRYGPPYAQADLVEVPCEEGALVSALALSSSGETLAVALEEPRVEIQLLSLSAAGPPRALLGHTLPVHALAFSTAGDRLVSAGGGPADDGIATDNSVRVWELAAGRELVQTTRLAQLTAVAVDPTGLRYAAGDTLCMLTEFDAALAPKEARRGERIEAAFVGSEAHNAPVVRICYGPQGRRLYSLSVSPERLRRELRVWDVETGRNLGAGLEWRTLRTFDLSPDGSRLLVGLDAPDARAELWSAASLEGRIAPRREWPAAR